MFSLRNLVFLAVAVSGSVIPRDVGQVKRDLETINADTQAVTKAVNSFTSVVQGSEPMLAAENTLTHDIESATADTKAVGKVSESDADDIINYVHGNFQPSIDAALSALKSKKDKFKADGIARIVKMQLEKLKGVAGQLSEALVENAPASRVEQAKAIKAHIDTGLDDAIKDFS
ncbi:hypothetical protein E4U54_006935 [Claviceps lovelessii]|nr:hypothetical protein E4U54_006935 [Claviceps lovelessii]